MGDEHIVPLTAWRRKMTETNSWREHFPILGSQVYGKPLVYLDNAATMQMPDCVIEHIAEHYRNDNANVHRGVHYLSERSSAKYENARKTVAKFLNAEGESEIVFASGCTASINLVAKGLKDSLKPGDEIIVTNMEHHSDYVVWQQLCKSTGAVFRVLELEDGRYSGDRLRSMLGSRTRLVCTAHVSNVSGTCFPVKEIAGDVHEAGALYLVDGAQAICREMVDVRDIDCDFYCFSGHKVMAPTGIGVLYGKKEQLEKLTPPGFGGGMVDIVTEGDTSFAPLPYRLEAGTPNYVGAGALARALEFIDELGREKIVAEDRALTACAEEAISAVPGCRILGHPDKRSGVVSFVCDKAHSYDIASVMDKYGIAVRSGTHCAQPALSSFGCGDALRVSVAFYNTRQEIQYMAECLSRTIGFLEKWRNI